MLLVVSAILRAIPLFNNNLYFTADQGRDAIYVREILTDKKILLRGPETTVRGIYTGPLWYYFLAIGYFVTNGHPVGGVLMMILLQLATLLILALWLKGNIGESQALVVVLGLSVNWWFFDSSRYAFNPFPLVLLCFLLTFSLLSFLDGKKGMLIVGLLVVALAYNANIAGTLIFLGVWALVGLWGGALKVIKWRQLGVGFSLLSFLGFYFGRGFVGTVGGASQLRTSNFSEVVLYLGELIGRVVFPQAWQIGIGLFLFVLLIFFVSKKGKTKENRFVVVSLLFIMVSLIVVWLGGIFRDWYFVYLPPILYVALGIMLFRLGRVGKLMFVVIGFLQLITFVQNYQKIIVPSTDKSILANQLKVVDEVYKLAENQGFAVYTYTDSYFDYPQQYLFWWRGLKKHGFLPCEYSNLPYTSKLYVPSWADYTEPKRWCEKYRFLIVESRVNGETNFDWIDNFRQVTKLVDEKRIGNVGIEKREIMPLHNEYYFRDLIFRDYRKNEMAISIPIEWKFDDLNSRLLFSNKGGEAVVEMARIRKNCIQEEDLEGVDRLVKGEKNDYSVSFKLVGIMNNAWDLIEKISTSAKVFEDQNTPKEVKCLVTTD